MGRLEAEMKLPNVTIAAKLYAIFALLVGTTVGLAVVAIIDARHQAALNAEYASAFAGAKNVELVNGLLYAVVMESRGIFMSADIKSAKPFSDSLLRFNDRIGQVVNDWHEAVRADDAALFGEFSLRISQFQEFRREVVRRGTEISPAVARDLADQDAPRAVRIALNNDLEALAGVYAKRLEGVNAEMARDTRTAESRLSVLIGLAVLLASAGAIIIWRAVVRPLAKITEVTQAVATGALEVVVPFSAHRDEIGALARSITVFQKTMRRNQDLDQASRAAQARGRRQEEIDAKIARFSAEIEATLAELGNICGKMLGASARLTGAADQATARTATATKASADASASVKDIAAAAEELASSINEIDHQAAQSNDIASKAVTEAERTHSTVRQLNEAAGRIGDVLRLITDVAEQTNLLALNATIEAARAGNAGRGFAVVASEVKVLAGQTAKATGDIGAQIARMKQATLDSIEAIAAIETTIREIGNISSGIAAAVTQQGMATHRIARGAEIAAERTIASAGEVERVLQAATDTHASVSAVQSVADELGVVATRIRVQIQQFFEQLHAA
jgi:methyl-accepting chemotaxis protein